VRFGVFVFDPISGDLWKDDRRIRLHDQARMVLLALVERPGQLVSREDLRRVLWTDDTFVEVDTALNVIVTRLRRELDDSATSPRFIETLPRRGYRFVAPIAAEEAVGAPPRRAPDRPSDHPADHSVGEPSHRRHDVRRRALWLAGSAALVALAAWLPLSRQVSPSRVVRAVVPAPSGTVLGRYQLALAKDGQKLVLRASDRGVAQLWIESLATGEVVAVPGSSWGSSPAFAPDGSQFGFCAEGALKVADIASLQVTTLLADGTCGTGMRGGGMSWNSGEILYATGGEIRRASSSGGGSVAALKRDASGLIFTAPAWLPDGRHFLVHGTADDGRGSGVYIADAVTGEYRFLCQATGGAHYVRPDLLVYVAQRQLLARRFDVRTLRLTSAPVALATNARTFAVSDDAVVYFEDRQPSHLVWMSRDGSRLEQLGQPKFFGTPRLSPEGMRVAYHLPSNGESRGVWIYDLLRHSETRVSAGGDLDPVWSPDAQWIAYDREIASVLMRSAMGGPGEKEILRDRNVFPTDWSPDGAYLAFVSGVPPRAKIRRLSPPGADMPIPLNGGNESYNARFSPDGHWLAYTSDESGPADVYVTPFPALDRKWKVSPDGGAQSVWRKDGRELFYIAPDLKLTAVSVHADGAGMTLGRPVALFAAPVQSFDWPAFDASADGQRFLVNAVSAQPPQLHIITNWKLLVSSTR
jgi:DNA-binding winged helix-turn-helix (wHTH) protein/WD40 repeat protein